MTVTSFSPFWKWDTLQKQFQTEKSPFFQINWTLYPYYIFLRWKFNAIRNYAYATATTGLKIRKSMLLKFIFNGYDSQVSSMNSQQRETFAVWLYLVFLFYLIDKEKSVLFVAASGNYPPTAISLSMLNIVSRMQRQCKIYAISSLVMISCS